MTRPQLLKSISKKLIEKKETLAVAESVTAGLLTATLSLSSNTTMFLQGGVIAYNLGQKTRHLRVDPIHADEVNCVSESVARQMALEITQSFCSHWGIAVTGYAVPVPALKIKSCFVHYAFVHRGIVTATGRIDTKLSKQDATQRFFVDAILQAFSDHLTA